jgi:ferritin
MTVMTAAAKTQTDESVAALEKEIDDKWGQLLDVYGRALDHASVISAQLEKAVDTLTEVNDLMTGFMQKFQDDEANDMNIKAALARVWENYGKNK